MKYSIDMVTRDVCFEGFFTVARYQFRHSLFAGGWSNTIERERVERLNAAAAILYDPLRDQVVMVEQFRIGAVESGRRAWTIEPVGGMVAAGEDPVTVIRRESMEEAGCELRTVDEIGSYHVSPGTAADKVWLYCACVNAGVAGGVHGLQSEDEETRVVIIEARQAIAELFTGRIDTAVAIIGIQWLAMNRERLRMEWSP